MRQPKQARRRDSPKTQPKFIHWKTTLYAGMHAHEGDMSIWQWSKGKADY